MVHLPYSLPRVVWWRGVFPMLISQIRRSEVQWGHIACQGPITSKWHRRASINTVQHQSCVMHGQSITSGLCDHHYHSIDLKLVLTPNYGSRITGRFLSTDRKIPLEPDKACFCWLSWFRCVIEPCRSVWSDRQRRLGPPQIHWIKICTPTRSPGMYRCLYMTLKKNRSNAHVGVFTDAGMQRGQGHRIPQPEAHALSKKSTLLFIPTGTDLERAELSLVYKKNVQSLFVILSLKLVLTTTTVSFIVWVLGMSPAQCARALCHLRANSGGGITYNYNFCFVFSSQRYRMHVMEHTAPSSTHGHQRGFHKGVD